MAEIKGDGGSAAGKCDLLHLRSLKELPKETLNALEGIGRPLRLSAGKTLASEGERPQFIGCVVNGILRMQKTLQDGRQQILGLLVEGDMFGQILNGPLNYDIEVATDAEICAFKREPFEELLMHEPELDRVLMLNMLNELDRARDWMIILANPRVKGRLAGFILVLCTRFSELDDVLQARNGFLDVKIPISRADLAHLLGTRPESISRAFHGLADIGAISILSPDLIEIRNVDALIAESGEELELSNAFRRDLKQILSKRIE